MFHQLERHILSQSATVVDLQRQLTALQALSPENGGAGELAKATLILNLLGKNAQPLRFDCPDPRVPSGVRPNLAVLFPGKKSRRLWLFSHLDVVPPGDLSLWDSDPWQIKTEGDFIIGRGVEDNQQAIVSMLILAKSLEKLKITPELGLGLVFMADEECGSHYGLEWLLKQQPQLFKNEDLYIVPDGGSPDAKWIEIAEKAQVWLKFIVWGKQCHASAPVHGVNSFLAASQLVCKLAELGAIFNKANPLFKPPVSTFVPTRHENNVEAINILPGKDIFYLDCRLLPDIDISDVLKRIRDICADIEAANKVKIETEIVQSQPATEVAACSPVITALQKAIRVIYNVDAIPVGIGGATVAAFLRQAGLSAVVWSCLLNSCHQPNERSSISATLKDAAVFAHILMDTPCQ